MSRGHGAASLLLYIALKVSSQRPLSHLGQWTNRSGLGNCLSAVCLRYGLVDAAMRRASGSWPLSCRSGLVDTALCLDPWLVSGGRASGPHRSGLVDTAMCLVPFILVVQMMSIPFVFPQRVSVLVVQTPLCLMKPVYVQFGAYYNITYIHCNPS